MRMPDVPSNLFTSFNAVTYYDEPHKYYLNGNELISVTTLIHKYINEFDEEYWSEIKAEEYGLSIEQVLYAWDFLNEFGTTKGSAIHDYAENLFNNKKFPSYPKNKIMGIFGYDAIGVEYHKTKKLVNEFHKLSNNNLIPIKTEFIIYDEEYMVGGMVDVLFYNVKKKIFQLYDWKTNKEYWFESKFGNYLIGRLFGLEECEHTIYSLQLSLYKYIIEKNTGIKLGDSYMVWISHANDRFYTYKAEDYSKEVKMMLNDNKFNLI